MSWWIGAWARLGTTIEFARLPSHHGLRDFYDHGKGDLSPRRYALKIT